MSDWYKTFTNAVNSTTVMLYITLLSFIACACSIIALSIRNSKYNSVTISLSAVSILASFVALALAAPRNMSPSEMNVDYLGVIVAILAAIAALLLAMQLYNVFGLKEDAQKAEAARKYAEESATRVDKMEEKYPVLQDKINMIEILITKIQEKNKNIELQYNEIGFVSA